jgi:hypothetical protein
MNWGARGWLAGIACMVSLLLAASGAGAATTITVTRQDDPDNGLGDCASIDTSCSLREAVNVANSDPSITQITLPAGEYDLKNQVLGLQIAGNLTLAGAGARTTTIKQIRVANVLNIHSGKTVTVQGVTITGGHAIGTIHGGGISNSGALTLQDSRVTDNESDGLSGASGEGGGIANFGTSLLIIRSTIDGNHADAASGPSAQGGGIYSTSSATIVNSTIAGNTVDGGSGTGSGGGIHMLGGATLNLANSTVAFNTAFGSPAQGGNIDLEAGPAPSTAKNSIIADGTADIGSENCIGTLGSEGFNLEDRDECGLDPDSTNQVSKDAKLGQLGDHGGPLATVPLLSGSPAINGGNNAGCRGINFAVLDVDERGVHRPQGPRCDIGAFEFRVPVLKGLPQVSGAPRVGQKLTCLLPAVQSADGPSTVGVAWLRNGAFVTNGRSYVVRAADRGHALRCRFKATNAAGSASATSRAVSVR